MTETEPTRADGCLTVGELRRRLEEYAEDMPVGGWSFHFLPLVNMDVEEGAFATEDGQDQKRECLVLSFGN